MIEIIKNMFISSKKKIPSVVEKALFFQFPEAINIDWQIIDNGYEAIFYNKEVEYIAKISKSGKLYEYKKNLNAKEVPLPIQNYCINLGEIMSAIAIYTINDIIYELIIRNTSMIRFLLLFDINGNLLNKNQL